MSEGPTATPEPLPWGSPENPFPVGTRFRTGDVTVVVTEVEIGGLQDVVYVDGFGWMPKEVQGRINEEGWEPIKPAE